MYGHVFTGFCFQGGVESRRADIVVGELVKKFCGLNSAAPLQPLLEAIDADASSSITIAELEVFTRMAPKSWTYVDGRSAPLYNCS